MAQSLIVTTGTILALHGPRTFHAALPNGKRVIAHVPRRLQEEMRALSAGARVRLEMTTLDFSMARIVGLET